MDNIGTEVSLKIRSAIKAKLMELGAFVDEELPDYIMVMVANKRSKQQMDVDLQLFLGPNTTNFTMWLHTVLQKLEEVTIAKNLALSQKKSNTKLAEGVEVTLKTRSLSTNPTEGESHKHRHEKKKKSFESTSKKQTKESKSVDKNSSKKKSTSSVPNIKLEEPVVNWSSVNNSKQMGGHITSSAIDSVHVDSRTTVARTDSANVPTRSVNSQSSNPVASEEEDEDFINIKEDTDAMDLLDAELLDDSRKLSCANVLNIKTRTVPVKAVTLPDEEVDDLEIQRANLLRDLRLLDKPSKSSVEKRSIIFDRFDTKFPATSALDQLGNRVDARPRLNIIDPNELDIVAPTQREVELTKQKVADRLGKKPTSDEESLENAIIIPVVASRSRIREDNSNLQNIASKSSRDRSRSRSRDDLFEDSNIVSSSRDRRERGSKDYEEKRRTEESETKRGVRERLGDRMASTSKRNVTVNNYERRQLERSEAPRIRAMDRLGKKVMPDDLLSDKRTSPHEHEATKLRVADRLGKKVTPNRSPPRDTNSGRGSVMDRLGKKPSGPSDERDSPTSKSWRERDDRVKKTSRIISIKEAVKGEVQYATSSKRSAEEHSGDEVPRKRTLLSRVVAVKRDPAADEEDEQYDPTNPAVASVIRVKPRPKVPAAMQATKNLLLKAMAEAQKSVSSIPVRQDTQSQRVDGLFTRKYWSPLQPVDETGYAVANPLDERETRYEDGEDEERTYEAEGYVDEKRMGDVTDTEAQSLQGTRQKMTLDQVKSSSCTVGDNNLNYGHSPKPEDDEDDLVFEEIFDDELNEEDLNEEDLNEMTLSNGGSNLGNVSSINVVVDDGLADTSVYVPTKIEKTGPSRRTVRTGSPQFVVTLDGLDPNIFNPRKRAVDATESRPQEQESGVVSPAPGLDPDTDDRIHNWLLSLDRVKKEEEGNEDNASPVVCKKPKLSTHVSEVVKAKSLDRCKYWPACSKGDLCEFLHPATTCKMFPSCKFGDRCLYVHPSCKFDMSCTRRECPYSHTSGRGGSLQAQALPSGKSRAQAQPLCKFYPKCSNVNCSFLHPKPCRFGRACTNRDCIFFHEEIPTAEKLKWVNTNRF